MSTFLNDLEQEKILSVYLDKIYRDKKLDFRRISDLKLQHAGVDVEINIQKQVYCIDEKAQLHYLNQDLPTFTFEISYLKNNILKEGWLFDKNKKSDYYFLITGIYLKHNKSTLQHTNDIEHLKITSVNRNKLINYLNEKGLDKFRIHEYEKDIRENNTYGTYSVGELDPKKEGRFYFTKHLSEQPINLQLRLSHLIEQKIAKKFHYV